MATQFVYKTVTSLDRYNKRIVLDDGNTYSLRYFPVRNWKPGDRVAVAYDDAAGGRNRAVVKKSA